VVNETLTVAKVVLDGSLYYLVQRDGLDTPARGNRIGMGPTTRMMLCLSWVDAVEKGGFSSVRV
jgi:hypothetical protein